jgi:anti-sigma factor RsiW
MNRCEQYEPFLVALADDQVDALPAELRKDLLEHVAACPACQADIARQRQLAQLLATGAPPAVPTDRWQQAWDAVDRQTTSRTRSLRLPFASRNRWAAVAASAAVAAIVLLATLLQPFGEPAPRQFAFATGLDSDIQVLETDAQNETPMIVTSGQEDLVVVWIVQDADEDTHT